MATCEVLEMGWFTFERMWGKVQEIKQIVTSLHIMCNREVYRKWINERQGQEPQRRCSFPHDDVYSR